MKGMLPLYRLNEIISNKKSKTRYHMLGHSQKILTCCWSSENRALLEKYLHEDRDQRVAKLVTQTTLHKKVMPFITCL